VKTLVDVVVIDDFATYDKPHSTMERLFKGAPHGKGSSLYMKISSTKEISRSL
jgi:hypothetical protein